MLCASCAGTEFGLESRSDDRNHVQMSKNPKDGVGCPRCDSAGQVPTIVSACSHCGVSILAWRPCPDCVDSAAYKTAHVKSAQAASKISAAVQ